jgi:hypothetical protein
MAKCVLFAGNRDHASGGHGIRPPSQDTGKTDVSQQGGAESGAVGADAAKLVDELIRIVTAWPLLPAPIRQAILTLLDAVE